MTKRSKQAQDMVDAGNEFLRNNGITDPFNDYAMLINYILHSANIYEGYNNYKEEEFEGAQMQCLDKEGYIQFH